LIATVRWSFGAVCGGRGYCTLANQTMRALWIKHSDAETCDRQLSATVAALVGIGPKDELEGMMAAQLIAAHNAAMECYRRAMIGEQTVEGRRENLNQANKLSRTWATLLEALNKHRGKGQQKVTVRRTVPIEGVRRTSQRVEVTTTAQRHRGGRWRRGWVRRGDSAGEGRAPAV
jgi:hypothetical protein